MKKRILLQILTQIGLSGYAGVFLEGAQGILLALCLGITGRTGGPYVRPGIKPRSPVWQGLTVLYGSSLPKMII